MQALQINNPGEPLQLNNVPIPRAVAGHAVIKQQYSAINPMDWKIMKFNRFNSPMPLTPGWDVSGVITEVGVGVTNFSVGDRVFGIADILPAGGFAQYITVKQENITMRVNLPADAAGASSIVFGTAWNPLYIVDDLNKRRGQVIYIPGGGGGIGHLAVQLAKWSGLKVISSASKPESIKLAIDCGADYVIDYSKQDVVEEVLKFTNNEGVDIAFDSTYNSASFTQAAKVVKKGGRWIRVGGEAINSNGVNDEEAREVCKQRGVEATSGDVGRYWYPPHNSRFSEIVEMLDRCDALYKEGVRVRISKVIPFDVESVTDAEKAAEKGGIYGKYVIEIEKEM